MKKENKETIKVYFVGGIANHKVWGKNKKEVLNENPELRGKKLIYVSKYYIYS